MERIAEKIGELIKLEFNNQRVLTTQQLAMIYETDEKNIQMNFSNNKQRFEEGKHYYRLFGEILKEFKNSLPNDIGEAIKYAPSLILWTEKGANRHCKILDTDKAWEQFDILEETYFKVKTELPKISKELQAILMLDNRTEELSNQMKQLSCSVKVLENTATLDHGLAKNIQAKVTATVKRLCCGNESYAYLDKPLRRKVYSFVWRSLKDYFNVEAYHNLLKKEVQEANNQMCFSQNS